MEKQTPIKDDLDTIERTSSGESGNSRNDAVIDSFSPQEQKRIIRRVDIRIVLTLGAMYCVSLMDRTNLGIAVVAGMGVDMVLIGFRYSTITLVFFVTYVLLQPPATVVLRKVGPRAFLPFITVLWGITMCCFAFVRQWTDLIALRLVLGIFEAGFFPSCAYLLSCWYPRYDLQKRYAVFYLIGSMASAFSGILAFGFNQMGGLGNLGSGYGQHYAATATRPAGILAGIAGWRWIFIMQGLMTVCVGIAGSLLIADFPEKAATKSRSFALSFLTEREASLIVARIEKDRHDAIAEPFKLGQYMRGALDLKIWGFASLFMLTTTNTYAIAFFLPIILRGMGFSVAASQCLIAPPYVMAAIWMYLCAVLGDKYHLRGPFIVGNAIIGLIGLPILGFSTNANNIRGQWKRALASATLVGAGGIGGIIGSTVFREQDKPSYRPGIWTTILASLLVILVTLALEWKFIRANKRAAAGGKVIEGLEGFRYTL